MAEAFPIFVLTLEGDEERRAPLVAWLLDHGLVFELFFGVDGRAGLSGDWEASIDLANAVVRLGRKMGDGEFACALSHQEIYRAVLERGLPGAVVFEDDAVPGDGLVGFLQARAYHGAPMMLLDHADTRAVRGARVALPGGGLAGHPVAVPLFYANAYTVDAWAARFMRDASLPISFVADWPCDILRIGALAVMRRVAGHPAQGKGPSHLDRERQVKQQRFARFVTWGYWLRWWRKRRSVRLPDA